MNLKKQVMEVTCFNSLYIKYVLGKVISSDDHDHHDHNENNTSFYVYMLLIYT